MRQVGGVAEPGQRRRHDQEGRVRHRAHRSPGLSMPVHPRRRQVPVRADAPQLAAPAAEYCGPLVHLAGLHARHVHRRLPDRLRYPHLQLPARLGRELDLRPAGARPPGIPMDLRPPALPEGELVARDGLLLELAHDFARCLLDYRRDLWCCSEHH